MSYFNIRQALLTKLEAANVVPNADIAFENKSFDPLGKSLWLAVHFLPSTNEILGKTAASRNQQEGIFQVSALINKDDASFDNALLNAVDEILTEFSYNSAVTFSNQTVQILTSQVSNGRDDESWHVRDISINYLTFSAR